MWGKVAAISITATLALSGTAFASARHQGPVTVAEDAIGDWAAEMDPALAPAGDALGQDLVKASIEAHPSTIDFSITTTSLPEEAARLGVYAWDMRVNGKWWRLVNFLCDPTQYVTGATPPAAEAPESCVPEDGAGTHFEVMQCGDPRVVNIFANCRHRSTVEALVDAAGATITIPVPRDLMKIRSGTVIAPMDASGSSIVSGPALPYGGATAFPSDVMTWKKPYRVR